MILGNMKTTYSAPYTSTQIFNTAIIEYSKRIQNYNAIYHTTIKPQEFEDIKTIMFIAYIENIASNGKKLFNDEIIPTRFIHFDWNREKKSFINIKKLNKIYRAYTSCTEMFSFENSEILCINDSAAKFYLSIAINTLKIFIKHLLHSPIFLFLLVVGKSPFEEFDEIVNTDDNIKSIRHIFKSNQLTVHPDDTDSINAIKKAVDLFLKNQNTYKSIQKYVEISNRSYMVGGGRRKINDADIARFIIE